jgi:hypothetical protein
MIVKNGNYHKLFKKGLQKDLKDVYKDVPKDFSLGFNISSKFIEDDLYSPCLETKMLNGTLKVDYPESAEIDPIVESIDEHTTEIRYQLRVLDSLRDFVHNYKKHEDILSTTQKRFITRTLNKLHNED